MVLIERRQSGGGRRQDGHRVGLLRKGIEELPHVLVQQGVDGDLMVEVVEFGLGRQLAEDQQVGDLDERGVLGQLLDRVAPIAQDAGLAVQVCDIAFA